MEVTIGHLTYSFLSHINLHSRFESLSVLGHTGQEVTNHKLIHTLLITLAADRIMGITFKENRGILTENTLCL